MATRADQNGPFKEFVFEDWLREGIDGVCNEIKEAKSQMNLANFRRYIRGASREQLVAMRNIIDSAIERIDRQEAKTRQA